jgi:hypothetical protein
MVRFSVLINESLSGIFNSSTKDPLSPLLVVMEALSRMLSATVDRGLLLGLLVGSKDNNVLFSNLLFVDDTLSFCDTNLDHLRKLRCLFLYFEVVSGLKINLAKSELAPVSVVEDVGVLGGILL